MYGRPINLFTVSIGFDLVSPRVKGLGLLVSFMLSHLLVGFSLTGF